MARRPTNMDDLLRDLDESLNEFSEIARTETAQNADETAPVLAKKSIINEQINAVTDNANDDDDSAYDLLDSYGDDEATAKQVPLTIAVPVLPATNSTAAYGVRPPHSIPLPAHSDQSPAMARQTSQQAFALPPIQQQQLSPSQIYLQQQLLQRQQLAHNTNPQQQYQEQQQQSPTSGGSTSGGRSPIPISGKYSPGPTSASVRNIQPPNLSQTPNLARMNSNSGSIHTNQSFGATANGGFLSGDQIRRGSAATANTQSDNASIGGRRGSDATYNTNISAGDDAAQEEVRKLREQLERAKMELQDQLEMNKLLNQQQQRQQQQSQQPQQQETQQTQSNNNRSERKNEFQGVHKEMEHSKKEKSGDTSSVNSKTSGKSTGGWSLFGRSKSQSRSTKSNSTTTAAATEQKVDENGKPVVVKKKKKDDRPLMVMIDF
ncbi:hypothetical protein HK100_009530 [Physocladia obscura]|uniref:Uncharacterized protein n=1 Tax=Physocladia obscura TaxID=109957 RepID=A0AAD5T4B3_9FUNG|nr:hypothetical protein HK100_009530 [Physocladia obscura]